MGGIQIGTDSFGKDLMTDAATARPSPQLSLRGITKRFDGKTVLGDIDLDIHDGEFITLLGPSGCGKTTLLRMLAGFETPDEGSIRLDGQDIVALAPNQRPLNTVFQNYALFPHMTVFQNVAYGLRMEKCPAGDIRTRVEQMLAMVQLSDFAARKPHQLSGGQQQRVAIARAVIKRPRVLLLDEPLSALDFKLRKTMQLELKRIQRELGITFVFVTHDQEEALSMSDRVVVLNQGHIEQLGTPREVYERPASLFVAHFVGEANLLPGEITGVAEDGRVQVNVMGQRMLLRRPFFPPQAGQKVKILLRPEDMRLGTAEESGFPGRVLERSYKGSTLDAVVRLDAGPDILASEFFDEDYPDFDHRRGEPVTVTWVPSWEWLLPDADAPV
ncbi:putrescine/spermidine ABC transporter ATPase protein [Isoalcanivorax pacificus W11-5]|uniref:Spermidine/putrescine import ATP-binding protein PotA n=2 Tax=Isoalcanivorax TaxID=3020833 RepID=A0A0B4XKC1_9GAMM|nr:putrescine/spermidine ABC transporter ATPase protein [Isoalcanivorax pacificus W11-5]